MTDYRVFKKARMSGRRHWSILWKWPTFPTPYSLKRAKTELERTSDLLALWVLEYFHQSQPSENHIAMFGPAIPTTVLLEAVNRSFLCPQPLPLAFHLLLNMVYGNNSVPSNRLDPYNSIIGNQVSTGKRKIMFAKLGFSFFFFSFLYLFLFIELILYVYQLLSFYSWEHRKILLSTFLASRCRPDNQFWPGDCRSDVLFSQGDPTQPCPLQVWTFLFAFHMWG